MALKAKDETFTLRNGDTINVSVTPFVGSFGLELFTRAVTTLAPIAMPFIMANDKESVLDNEIDLNKVINTLTQKINEKTVLRTVMDLLSGTLIDGKEANKKANFDIIFAGEYATLAKILKFVVEVNYGDFLGENGMSAFMQGIPDLKKTVTLKP